MFNQSQKRHLFHKVMTAMPTGKRTKRKSFSFFVISGYFEQLNWWVSGNKWWHNLNFALSINFSRLPLCVCSNVRRWKSADVRGEKKVLFFASPLFFPVDDNALSIKPNFKGREIAAIFNPRRINIITIKRELCCTFKSKNEWEGKINSYSIDISLPIDEWHIVNLVPSLRRRQGLRTKFHFFLILNKIISAFIHMSEHKSFFVIVCIRNRFYFLHGTAQNSFFQKFFLSTLK